jgi:hypothetical protein
MLIEVYRREGEWMRMSMMIRLAAMRVAPRKTSRDFHFQIRSTRCPRGILKAHGSPTQKPSIARNSAGRSR